MPRGQKTFCTINFWVHCPCREPHFILPLNLISRPMSQLLPADKQLEHAHGPNLFRANSYDPKTFNLKDREGDEYDDQVWFTIRIYLNLFMTRPKYLIVLALKQKQNRAEQMQITIYCFYKTPKMSPDSRTPGLERQVREGPQPAPRPDQGRRRRPEEQEEAEVEIGRIQVRGFIMWYSGFRI